MKRRILIGLDLFTAVGAIFGGVAMLSDPAGSPIGMTQELLTRTPFTDFRLPGVLLIASNAVVPLIAAILVVKKAKWAVGAQLGAGAILMGWMGGQVGLVGLNAPIQFVMLAVGALMLRLTFDEAHPLRTPVG